MIPKAMSLTITTPLRIVAESDRVTSFLAEDESGGFGVMPGHVDLLSVLKSCVVRWRDGDGWRYCALHGGVLTVTDGKAIRIACREGVLGTDLPTLDKEVGRLRDEEARQSTGARLSQARLHARAIRQIMRHLSGSQGVTVDAAVEEIFQ